MVDIDAVLVRIMNEEIRSHDIGDNGDLPKGIRRAVVHRVLSEPGVFQSLVDDHELLELADHAGMAGAIGSAAFWSYDRCNAGFPLKNEVDQVYVAFSHVITAARNRIEYLLAKRIEDGGWMIS